MAIVTPSTDLILLQCPLEIDQQNQITFNSYDAQATYFTNQLAKYEVTDFTYQRKDGTVRFPAVYEEIRNYNYCMYKNVAYGNKWFYCFIEDMRYVNDGVTEIKLKTDVWQTWQLSLTFKQSYVLREHVNDDTFGLHTYPEDIEYGDYVVNAVQNVGTASTMDDCYFVVSVSELLDPMFTAWGSRARIYNGLPQGTYLFALAGSSYTEKYNNLRNMVRSYDKAGKSNAIMSMYVVPSSICSVSVPLTFNTEYGFSASALNSSTQVNTVLNTSIARNTSIDGYVPKNNKCFCAPYNYLMISNNGGTNINYRWEDFSSSNANFTMRSIVNEGCDIKLTPSNYKRTNLSGGYDYSVSMQKFPTISWNSDFYLNWQAYNSKYLEIKTGLNATRAGLGMVSSMATGNIGGMIGGALSMADVAADAQHQVSVAEMTPDSAKGNSNTGDFNFTVGKTVFTAYKMSCKAEYIKLVDQYFSMFGYQVNTMKVPNIFGRRYWNYVKCATPNVIGAIPQDDMNEIKGMLSAGVTFWHVPSKYLDYSQNNTIV